jgi:AraC-like DNA-binding protein
MVIENISFKEYTKLFFQALPDGFSYQNTPVQIYKLDQIGPTTKTPTPLLKANFSFIAHLTAGTFEQQVGHEIKRVKPGSVLVAGFGQITSLINKSEDVDGFFIFFENSIFNEIMVDKALLKMFNINPLVQLSDTDNLMINRLNQILYEEIISLSPEKGVYISVLKAILYKTLFASRLEQAPNRSYEIAVKFREMAFRFFSEGQQLPFYALKLGVSETYLNRSVKKTFGKTPKEILIEFSIIQAKLNLKDLTKSISEVAYELNFDDPSYFGRLFKQVTGETPTQYRKTIQPEKSDYQTY